jgi:hypothetical protein
MNEEQPNLVTVDHFIQYVKVKLETIDNLRLQKRVIENQMELIETDLLNLVKNARNANAPVNTDENES